MEKIELIRERLPSEVDEVQANAHNRTIDDQELEIEPLIVQSPYDETKQLGFVDVGSAT
ncbi:hypothetical protein MMC31_003212 [Peltigera leucophlebia]|nr:hypothetical protein [Peltigera leucophlebia]